MTFADANWSDIIAGGVSVIIIARIEEATPDPAPEEGLLSGIVRLRFVRGVSTSWRGPATILVSYTQYDSDRVRAREGRLGWNGVDLREGTMILIAVPPVETSWLPSDGPLAALSVSQVSGLDDGLVAAVERALAIEVENDIQKRIVLLREGARSSLPFLAAHSHYAMGRLARIPRREAITIEIDFLREASQADRAQSVLESELWHDDAPEDPLNKQILAAFFQSLLAQDHEFVKNAVSGIYNMLEAENPSAQEYREKLVRGAALPPTPPLLAVLSALRSDPEVGSDATWLSAWLAKR